MLLYIYIKYNNYQIEQNTYAQRRNQQYDFITILHQNQNLHDQNYDIFTCLLV